MATYIDVVRPVDGLDDRLFKAEIHNPDYIKKDLPPGTWGLLFVEKDGVKQEPVVLGQNMGEVQINYAMNLGAVRAYITALQDQVSCQKKLTASLRQERDEARAMVEELRREHMTGEELRAILLHKDKPKPGTICFFCGEPVTGTTHFDRWHSKTRRRLPSVYVCDECFDKHPMIVKIPEA